MNAVTLNREQGFDLSSTNGASRSTVKIAGGVLVAAAAVFWSAWWFMPVAGVTDTETIFELVTPHRNSVLAAAILQLIAAALFVPAMIALIRSWNLPFYAKVWRPAAVLTVGTLGLAADAIDHMLSYAMTAPGIDQSTQVEAMQFMQGPGLMIIVPLIACFFVGGGWLSVSFARAGVVTKWNPRLHLLAVTVGAVGAGIVHLTDLGLDGRYVGIAVLGIFSAALTWIGVALCKLQQRGDATA